MALFIAKGAALWDVFTWILFPVSKGVPSASFVEVATYKFPLYFRSLFSIM